MSITIASTQVNTNNPFGPVLELNAPKSLYPGSLLTTTPGLALGNIAGTGIEYSNSLRVHVCDVVNEMNKDIAALKTFITTFISNLRTAIEALFDGISSNPFVEELKQKVETLKAKIKLITTAINDALDEAKVITEYVVFLRNLITEISNAPAELKILLQSCLSGAQSQLSTYQNFIPNNSAINSLKTLQTSVTTSVAAASTSITAAIALVANT